MGRRHEYDELICTQQYRGNYHHFCNINMVTGSNKIPGCHDSENLYSGFLGYEPHSLVRGYQRSTRTYSFHRQECFFGTLITVYKTTHSYNIHITTVQEK
jgi:hypothetical protein